MHFYANYIGSNSMWLTFFLKNPKKTQRVYAIEFETIVSSF